MLRFRITEALSRRAWVIPLARVGAGIGLSFATVAIDRHTHAPLLPSGLVGNATDAGQILVRQLAPRPFSPAEHVDDNGQLRLVTRSLSWDGYVRLAFDEIRLAAGPFPQVTRRLEAALQDLNEVAPPDRRPPLERQLRLLEQAVEHELSSQDDIHAALTPDAQAISGADVVRDGSALNRA